MPRTESLSIRIEALAAAVRCANITGAEACERVETSNAVRYDSSLPYGSQFSILNKTIVAHTYHCGHILSDDGVFVSRSDLRDKSLQEQRLCSTALIRLRRQQQLEDGSSH
ncbi:hypothetical protein NLJ89_g6076 [Agrocybe chaxingu]|uniref:Uncharacterized protein n=1 Tax=Agrocybe chaxingu TaxID=84603 RepID=A0A9W8JZV1_9AGAR|nr:hypothetical protein NLJ89_g6076 [Agrocybe chaxingu]